MQRLKVHSICSIAAFLFVVRFASYASATSTAPVDLGAAGNFAILGGSGISNIPISAIGGNIGVSPSPGSTIIGFSSPATCPEVAGTVYANDGSGPACAVIDAAGLIVAKNALTAAYNNAEGRIIPAPTLIAGDQGGAILTPGLYKSVAAISIGAGNLTLDAQGDVNAVWIFQIGSTITTIGCGATLPCATGGNVLLINGANAANVFWQVGTAATIGQYTVFEGTILAHDDVSINTGARINGRILAGAQPSGAGAVTLISNMIVIPQAPGPIPRLSEWGMILLGCSLLVFLFIKANQIKPEIIGDQ